MFATNIKSLTGQNDLKPMINFFRNIRQKLIQENKVTQYLTYAIGEIFLVVIGILIAENLAPTLKGGFSRFKQ